MYHYRKNLEGYVGGGNYRLKYCMAFAVGFPF